MTSFLQRRPTFGTDDGVVQHVTAENAGWRYVGFEVIDLADRASLACEADGRELCLVPVSGAVQVTVAGEALGTIGGRTGPFDGPTDAVYVPPRRGWEVRAVGGPVELAVCSAPAPEGRYPVRVIRAAEIGEFDRGSGTNLRRIRNVLPDTAPAEALLVVEVVTPGGHWSSYPPHKHDTDDAPRETALEETYYHRLRRGAGFAVQRVYTRDGTLDETIAVGDRDVVLVPKGYHPVGAPHGFDLWYLNVMAGPVREWRFTMDPDHAHLPY